VTECLRPTVPLTNTPRALRCTHRRRGVSLGVTGSVRVDLLELVARSAHDVHRVTKLERADPDLVRREDRLLVAATARLLAAAPTRRAPDPGAWTPLCGAAGRKGISRRGHPSPCSSRARRSAS
jgi:hypothetical protein